MITGVAGLEDSSGANSEDTQQRRARRGSAAPIKQDVMDFHKTSRALPPKPNGPAAASPHDYEVNSVSTKAPLSDEGAPAQCLSHGTLHYFPTSLRSCAAKAQKGVTVGADF